MVRNLQVADHALLRMAEQRAINLVDSHSRRELSLSPKKREVAYGRGGNLRVSVLALRKESGKYTCFTDQVSAQQRGAFRRDIPMDNLVPQSDNGLTLANYYARILASRSYETLHHKILLNEANYLPWSKTLIAATIPYQF